MEECTIYIVWILLNTGIDSVFNFKISEKNVVLHVQQNAASPSSPPLWCSPAVLNSLRMSLLMVGICLHSEVAQLFSVLFLVAD